MKRKQFWLLLTSSLTFVSAIVVAMISTNGKGIFYRTFGSSSATVWNHYQEVSPTFDKIGIKEYWVSCSTSEHLFVTPTGSSIQITDKGQPSQEFIESLSESDDRLLPQIPRHISFEDDYDTRFILSNRLNTAEISTEQHHFGEKSLKIVTFGDMKALTVNKAYYDSLPDSGISFWVYCDTAFNGNLGSGTTIYNGGKANANSISYWDVNAWRQFVISKSSITAHNEDYYVFLAPSNTTLYIDDVKPYDSTPKTIYDFEDQYDTMTVNSQGASYEISTEQAHSGNGSLKVSGLNNWAQVFNISDDLYNSLSDEGISFWAYATQAFNMQDGVGGQTNHYWGPFNVWKHYTFTKAQIDATVGRHYVFLPYGIDPTPLTVYIDDVRAVDFVDTDNISGDTRNTNEITDELIYEGTRSLKVTMKVANSGLFLIKQSFYESLPVEGITFYVNCSRAFNAAPGIEYRNLNDWQQFTVAKANIQYSTSIGGVTYYYVCLPTEAFEAPIYVDGIAAVPVSGETLNDDIIDDGADDSWYN